MAMYRKSKLVLAVLFLFVTMASLHGHGDEPQKVSDLMKKKLTNAQKVLEGVVTGDFDKIAKHADELMVISKAVEWKVVRSPQYEMHTNQFRRAVDDLSERAKEKNLDGAALSYVDMTLSCVKCHKYVRETKTALLDP
jgi:hypothetical protein